MAYLCTRSTGTLRVLWAVAAHTVGESIRNRLLWLSGCLLLLAFVAGEFLAEVALTETRAYQISFMAAILRLGSVAIIAIFVVTSTLREFQEKGVDLVLSLPAPRWAYVLGKFAGFTVSALVLATLSAILAAVHAPWPDALGWGVSLASELVIVAAFGLLCLLTFSQPTAALFAVLLFYVCARTISALVLMASGPFTADSGYAHLFLRGFFGSLAYLLPDLSAFASTDWLLSGAWSSAVLERILLESAVYVGFLLAASLFDFYRRSF